MRPVYAILLFVVVDWTLFGGRITEGLGREFAALPSLMDEDLRGSLRRYTIEPFFGR